jgi:hypothetical protein
MLTKFQYSWFIQPSVSDTVDNTNHSPQNRVRIMAATSEHERSETTITCPGEGIGGDPIHDVGLGIEKIEKKLPAEGERVEIEDEAPFGSRRRAREYTCSRNFSDLGVDAARMRHAADFALSIVFHRVPGIPNEVDTRAPRLKRILDTCPKLDGGARCNVVAG